MVGLEDFEDASNRPCVILGSGFSRAISDEMPTMWDLGAEVLEDLALPETTLDPFGGSLEQWMSYLSIDQPWLTPAENYENRGMFTRVSEAVYGVIRNSEMEALGQPPPTWLIRLAWTWCDLQARVFTFNYDTLLERAFWSVNRVETPSDFYAAALEERHAFGDGARYGAGPPHGNVPSVFKLHGSTNWAFGGIDGPPSDRIVLLSLSLAWQPDALSPESTPRELMMYDDLSPLIVPPTLTKGPFFSNQTLRAQWRRAADVMRNAKRLTVMGYSFPAGDLVAQQWVGTTFRGKSMDVVDTARQRPKLIRQTLLNARDGDDVTGKDAIKKYVDRECGDHVAWSLYGFGDSVGPRIKLEVNGRNALSGVDPRNPPWGSQNYEDAQRWIHARVEAAGGSHDVDRATGAMTGAGEDRHVVLAPGKHLELY